MATCPLCLFANSPEATVCARCGKFSFPGTLEHPVDAPTRTVAQLRQEAAALDESGRRTVRGPLTVPTNGLATIAAPAVGDSYAVAVDATPPPLGPAPPRLIVVRGEKLNAEFLLLGGKNYLGRAADKPVDIDLTGLEAADQVWSSRQHAVITSDRGTLFIEDLNSLNGTFVNRSRLHPGQQRVLQSQDVIQIGTVQFRVMM